MSKNNSLGLVTCHFLLGLLLSQTQQRRRTHVWALTRALEPWVLSEASPVLRETPGERGSHWIKNACAVGSRTAGCSRSYSSSQGSGYYHIRAFSQHRTIGHIPIMFPACHQASAGLEVAYPKFFTWVLVSDSLPREKHNINFAIRQETYVLAWLCP